MKIKLLYPVLGALLVAMTQNPCHAQWSSLANFESLTPGAIGGQGGWTTTGTTADYDVVVDPADPSNQVLRGIGTAGSGGIEQANAYLPLGGGIADGTTGTVFYRARTTEGSDFVFGSSDVAAPTGWGDYEGYSVLKDSDSANPGGQIIQVRNGGGFDDIGTYPADEWINVWLVLNNTADTATIYTSQGTGTASLVGSGAFRNGTADPLVAMNLRMGGIHATNAAEGFLDDIYVDASGQNLTIPAGISNPPMPGDVNLDGDVDIDDYLLIRNNFRQTVADPTLGDLTGPSGVRDGVVDFYDFGEWKANASAGALEQAANIPEPSCLVLLAVGVAAVAGVGRRTRCS